MNCCKVKFYNNKQNEIYGTYLVKIPSDIIEQTNDGESDDLVEFLQTTFYVAEDLEVISITQEKKGSPTSTSTHMFQIHVKYT